MKEQLLLTLANKRLVNPNGIAAWTAARSIQLFGVRVGIQTNRSKLLEKLTDHFPPLWQSAKTSTVDRIFSLHFGKNLYTVFEDYERGLTTNSCKRMLEEFERRLKIYIAEMARRRVFVHAGAVGWKGKAIIIPGRSYAGKTTLVRELVRAGATYYSDEYAVLDMQGRLHPYPQPLAIRQNGSYKQKKYPVETLGGVAGRKPLPISLVVLSKYRENARWRPLRLTVGQGVLALLDNTVPARRKPEVVFPTLHKAIEKATILKGDRGEVEGIVSRILEGWI